MSLYVFQSNRLENLAKMLGILQQNNPLTEPFSPEHFIVQSQGIRRYISQFLAKTTGIAANLKFTLPGELAWRLMRQAMPTAPELSPFSSEVMRWRLLDLFQSDEFATDNFQAAQTALNDYLDNGDYAAYQLAGEIADVFDQYLVYRPDWIDAWANGEKVPELSDAADANWQANLWKYLQENQKDIPHRVQLWRTLMDKLTDEKFATKLPERYFAFGISTLAPMYLKLLQNLSIHCDVFLFALNPSEKFWGDVLEPEQILRLDDDAEDFAAQGHPLLASMGKQGRDFFNELAVCEPIYEAVDYAEKARSGSLLHHIQYDIQTLTLPENTHFAGSLKNDNSLQIHAAHSSLRELQILKDQILKLLNENKDLQPHQIAVLVPHIEPYAPYIEAVFGKFSGSTALPYTISDVKISRHQPLLDALEQAMNVLDSRFEANKILALLDNQLILDKFQISRADLPLLHDIVQKLNVRWGSDAGERAQYGDDSGNLFTWQQALERLVLGFMLPEKMWHDIAVYPVHPDQIGVLSQFIALVKLLSQTKSDWQQPTPPADWCDRMRQLLSQLVEIKEQKDRSALQKLEEAWVAWQAQTDTANFARPISRTVALQHVKRFLTSPDDAAFLRGGLTFCSMIPMRSLPFEVICLLGMNDGEMPRNTKASPFDLIAKHPRKGDRARRDDDRYLFLETMLSARRVLYLSYIGKDIRSDEDRAASTLIGEIVDTVADMTGIEPSDLQENWIVHHPLQPFSRQYFSGRENLQSARQDYANALNNPLLPFAPFINSSDKKMLPEKQNLVLQEDFIQFWRNPTRYWLRNQLNWQQPYSQSEKDSEEPFLPDSPRQLADAYLLARQNKTKFEEIAQKLTAQSQLPTGKLGEFVQNEYAARAADWPSEIVFSKKLPERGGVLSGYFNYRLAHNFAVGQILSAAQFLSDNNQNGKLTAPDKIAFLLNHLIYCAATPDTAENRETHYLSMFEKFSRLPAIGQTDAQNALDNWLKYYELGKNAPIPFFARTSLAAATEFFASKTNKSNWDAALKKAAQKYHSGYRTFAESDYPEIQLVYGRDVELPYRRPEFENMVKDLFEVFSGCLKVLENGED